MEHIISAVLGGVLEENKIEIWVPIHSILEYKSSKESKYNKKYAKVKRKKQSLWMKRWKNLRSPLLDLTYLCHEFWIMAYLAPKSLVNEVPRGLVKSSIEQIKKEV